MMNERRGGAVIEARADQAAPFTFISADRINGKREFRFLTAQHMYEWVLDNRTHIAKDIHKSYPN